MPFRLDLCACWPACCLLAEAVASCDEGKLSMFTVGDAVEDKDEEGDDEDDEDDEEEEEDEEDGGGDP